MSGSASGLQQPEGDDVARNQVSAVQHRRETTHDEEQRQEHRHLDQLHRVEQCVEVETHAADDEEQRDEEPETERLDPVLHLTVRRFLGVRVALTGGVTDEEQSGDHAGGERAEQHVEPELGRQPHEEQAEHHTDPHPELRSSNEASGR